MKKLIVFIVCGLMFVLTMAQITDKPKHEISVSAGVLPLPDSRIFTDVLLAVITFGLVVPDDETSYGSYSLEYTYNHSDKLAFGVLAGYSANKSTYKSGYNNMNYRSEEMRRYYYLMPTLKYIWSRHTHINFYSYLGFGAYFRNEKSISLDSSTDKVSYNDGFMPAIQITPIALEAGNNNIKFFTELGFGNKGLLCAGLRFGF